MVGFERPVGASADVKELEYISALHQTSDIVRTDGSIKAADIKLFLRSRYGIEVSEEQVRNTILQGMGGSSEEDEVIDLMELTAILMIPVVLKASLLQEGADLPDGAEAPPADLIEYVSKMILHDVTGDSIPKQLTPELLKKILLAYGETELASDDELIGKMIANAVGETMSEDKDEENQTASVTLFDASTFAEALTSDVKLYNVANEVSLASSYQDVFLTKDNTPAPDSSSIGITDDKEQEQSSFVRIYTAPAIDTTAGTYRSKALITLLWTATLFSYFGIVNTEVSSTSEQDCEAYLIGGTWGANFVTMSCQAVASVYYWLFTFVSLCCYGVFVIGIGSLGNYTECRRWWMPVLAIISIFTIFIVSNVTTGFDKSEREYNYLKIVSVILASCVIFLHLLHLLSLIMSDSFLDTYPSLKSWLVSNPMEKELQMKSAMAYKLNQLTVHAYDIHDHDEERSNVLKTCFGHGLYVFSKRAPKFETVGGLVWGWKQIFSQDIFRKEGIWYSARLVASNLSQYIISVFILLAGILLVQKTIAGYDSVEAKDGIHTVVDYVLDTSTDDGLVSEVTSKLGGVMSAFLATLSDKQAIDLNCSDIIGGSGTDVIDSLCPSFFECDQNATTLSLCALIEEQDLDQYTQLGLLDALGLNTNEMLNITRDAVKQSVNHSVDSLYPAQLYMLTVPMIIGVAVAVIIALILAVSYLPSMTSTILQLRSGVIPTLHEETLEKYRKAPDSVTLLTGTLFWGCLFSSISVGAVAGGIIFLFLWQGSIYFMQRLVAIVIGILAITLLRVSLLICCRKSLFKAFYRQKPAAANITLLALEWANYALSVGFVFVRMVKLLIVAGFSIGRIDTPFLAKGVGQIGPLELDPFPTIHLRDILMHEAHRHPYIELLGKVYLMKLRYGTNFGNTAGSCWRLIFVYALLPWLQKYRIFAVSSDEPSTGLLVKAAKRLVDTKSENRDEEMNAENIRIIVELKKENLRLLAALAQAEGVVDQNKNDK